MLDAAGDVIGCNVVSLWDAVPALCRDIPVVMMCDATLRDPEIAALGERARRRQPPPRHAAVHVVERFRDTSNHQA